jgi:hypothetical protein
MKKIVLAFPSRESMAEFILAHRIINADTDLIYMTLTGFFPDDVLSDAFSQFGASISAAPDFILPD